MTYRNKPVAAWGMIKDTVAVGGVGVYALEGTVSCDGSYVVEDTGTLEVKLPGKYLISLYAINDADPPSGFTFWNISILVNGTQVGGDANTYVNAFQTYSGASDPVRFSFCKDGSISYIADLSLGDIITGEAEDTGTANSHSGNIIFTLTATYLGE